MDANFFSKYNSQLVDSRDTTDGYRNLTVLLLNNLAG